MKSNPHRIPYPIAALLAGLSFTQVLADTVLWDEALNGKLSGQEFTLVPAGYFTPYSPPLWNWVNGTLVPGEPSDWFYFTVAAGMLGAVEVNFPRNDTIPNTPMVLVNVYDAVSGQRVAQRYLGTYDGWTWYPQWVAGQAQPFLTPGKYELTLSEVWNSSAPCLPQNYSLGVAEGMPYRNEAVPDGGLTLNLLAISLAALAHRHLFPQSRTEK